MFCINVILFYICFIIHSQKNKAMSTRYTKADLERIVSVQLENLNAMHDLLSIMKVQNELIHNANKKLKEEIMDFKVKTYSKNLK